MSPIPDTMSERNSILATATALLAEQAKERLHQAWLQPGSRSMDRLADGIIDQLVQSLVVLHDFRLAQFCGLPPDGAPLLDQVDQLLDMLRPSAATNAARQERAAG